ncbi:MAG: transglutaminase domain-containing protein [SAR202 cluster bacterium]|nr:transglutaminase domain-containing protein [SAR202 cluster bacterium]
MTTTPNSLADTLTRRGGLNTESLGRWLNGLNHLLRPADGWGSVLLLALNLMVVVWSVERADWVPTPNLVSLVLVAMLVGLALSRIPIWAVLLLPVGLAVGFGVIVRELVSFEAKGVALSSAQDLMARLSIWLEAARSGSISIDPVPFAFGLMALTWLAGFLAGWVFFRYRNFWGVFLLGGAGILSNLTYLPPNATAFLALYLFTALLLAARVRSVRRRQEWDRRNIQYDGHLGMLSVSDSILLAIVVLTTAFLLPVGGALEPAHDGYEVLRTPLKSYEEDFNRLFAGLPARKPIPYRIWGDVLAFQGTINPTTTPVLSVSSPMPLYWKARSYSAYTSKGWVAEDTVLKPLDWKPAYSEPKPYQSRLDVTYTILPGYSSKNLFIAGQPVGANTDVRVETYDSPQYILNLSNPAALPAWPPRLAQTARNAERLIQAAGGAVTESALEQSLPSEFQLVRTQRQGGVIQTITVAELVPEQPDVLSMRPSRGAAGSGNPYQITSSVSYASPRELRNAGVDYPTWVLVRYTQLPLEVPQRVRDLAAQITANSRTPYDKVKAIETYLGTFKYSLEVDPPPYNVDGVDHFLFTLNRGYSEYFASATVVMARSVGIPARLATGYTVGDPGQEAGIYSVKDSHAHAWVEVFFPNYGWVPFEPTPGADLPGITHPRESGSSAPSAAATDVLDDLFCLDDDEDECFFDNIIPAQAIPSETAGSRLWHTFGWLLVLGPLSVLAAGLGWFWWRRYLTPSHDPRVAFRNLALLGSLGSVRLAAHETPLQYLQRLEEVLPDHRRQLGVVVNAYVRSTYGQKSISAAEGQELVQAWRQLRGPLMLRIMRRRTGADAEERVPAPSV